LNKFRSSDKMPTQQLGDEKKSKGQGETTLN